MKVKLFVSNLPKSITKEELIALFTQAGNVIFTDVITDRNSGKSRGFAFITMSTQSEAEKAIHLFNTYSLNKKILSVKFLQPTPYFL